MPLKAPDFWKKNNTFLSGLLSPFGALYAWVGRRRIQKIQPYRSKIPVVCIGNLVMGGVGKTPLAVSVGEYFKMNGMKPAFLTRGYGGGVSNVLIDLDKHTAKDTGDEALILAHVAPTIVDFDRKRGAKFAEKLGADVIIMDDGFQNPSLVKDLSFAVFDGRYGIGNGKVFPAGPLREKLEDGLKRANAFVVVGKDGSGIRKMISDCNSTIPFIAMHMEQSGTKIQQLLGKKIFAFAGIGHPDKFFDMLQHYGCDVVDKRAFSDHYPYSDKDMTSLLSESEKQNAVLVTTAKDAVRIPNRFLPRIVVVEAYMVWDMPDVMCALLSTFRKGG